MYLLRSFGTLALYQDHTPVEPLSSHRTALAVLIILAVDGPTSRERLMAILWPESDTRRARGSLKQAIHFLRRQLEPPAVLRGPDPMRVDESSIQCDVRQFREARAAGDFAAAAALYCGPFLDGVHIRSSRALEEWIGQRRQVLGREYHDVLESLVAKAEAGGSATETIHAWHRLQDFDPMDGRVALGVMRALAGAGQRSAALQHAQVHEAALRAGLGLGPDADVAMFAEALRRGEGSRDAGTGRTTSEAGRLVAEGLKAFAFGASGGSSANAHFDEAGVYFERALALDPNHARGLASFGNWHFLMGNTGRMPRDEAFARGRALTLAALAADDYCADVHCSMGKVAFYHNDDYRAAARHAERAVALEPANSEVLRFHSIVLKVLGRAEEAVEAARQAIRSRPELPSLWNGLGDALLAAGRNTEAIEALRRAVALQPAYQPALERLEFACTRQGALALALEIRASRLRLSNQRARADQMVRDAEDDIAGALLADARRELDALLEEAASCDPFADAFTTRNLSDRIILGCAGVGDWAGAMTWVEEGYLRRPGRLRRVLTDLPFDRHGLAADPRYVPLLRVAGMEDLL